MRAPLGIERIRIHVNDGAAHAQSWPPRRPHFRDHAIQDGLCLFLAVLLMHVIHDTLAVRNGGLDTLRLQYVLSFDRPLINRDDGRPFALEHGDEVTHGGYVRTYVPG